MNESVLWDKCLEAFNDVLSDKQMKTWFHPLEVQRDSNTLKVVAPNKFIKDEIENEYFLLIKETVINKSLNQVSEILLSLPDLPAQKQKIVEKRKPLKNTLNKDLTFNNFVEGKSNQLAKAACVSVVSALGQYNPLYIYGGVGMGKTHLLNAIGLSLKDKNKVMFISAERFMYQFVKSIKSNDMVKFKEYFRNTDILLIDDIQFMNGKEAMQEEFFHTFNALLDKGSQVILSADRAPNKLSRIQERIKSRFAGGLVVDIQKPDYDLRQKIVKTKIDELNVFYSNEVNISNEIQKFISLEIKTSIRELVGAINRIVSFSRIYNKIPNVSEAKIILKDLLNLSENKVTIDLIQSIVCKFFKISKNEMLSSRRSRYLVRPRQTAIYLTKILTSKSLPEIGREFSNRDHTTIIHSVKTIERLKENDAELSINIDNLKNKILYNKENEI